MAMEKALERTENTSPKTEDFYLIHIFGLKVARHMAAAVSCQSMLHKKPEDETLVENIETAKNNFYKALKEFIGKYPALPAVISAHLPALEELEGKDWSKDETIADISTIRERIFKTFRNELSIAV
jgi:hypothetical protein